MKKAILLSIMAGAMALPVYAENPSGPYVGGGFGQFNLEIDNLGDAGQSIIDVVKSDDSSWKVFAGWRLNPYLSLEAAYINLGDPNDRFSSAGSDGDYRVKMDGFSPAVVGTLPLGPIELFGRSATTSTTSIFARSWTIPAPTSSTRVTAATILSTAVVSA